MARRSSRINIEKFKKELVFEFQKKADIKVHQMTKAIVIETYKAIWERWPKYSYYSAANNRINISGGLVSQTLPKTRIASPGKHREFAEATFTNQISKVLGLDFPLKQGRKITIGNAVPYARDVGFTTGLGEAIYKQSLSIGIVTAEGRPFFD